MADIVAAAVNNERNPMKRTILAAALLGAAAAHAEPYVGVGLARMSPEITMGFTFGRVEAEASYLARTLIGSETNVVSSVEWYMEGSRLTLRGLLPLNEAIALTGSLGAAHLRFERKWTGQPTLAESVWAPTVGLGLKVKLNEHLSARAEVVRVQPKDAVILIESTTNTHISLSWSF
jgi:hypothetical protein